MSGGRVLRGQPTPIVRCGAAALRIFWDFLLLQTKFHLERPNFNINLQGCRSKSMADSLLV